MNVHENFIALIITAIKCSLIAICYHKVLIQPGNILSFIPILLNTKINDLRMINPDKLQLFETIFKPYLYCAVCLSGQLAFISTIFINHYSVLNSIFIICLTIIITWKIQTLSIK